MNYQKLISDSVKNVVDFVKEYSRSQKSLWQKVPWLANQANGRTGFSDDFRLTATEGMWTLNNNLCVDLEDGDILDRYFWIVHKEKKEPLYSYILSLAANNLNNLDAVS